MTQKKVEDVQNKIEHIAQKIDKQEINIGGKKFTGTQAGMIIATLINIIGCFLPFFETSVSVAGYSGASGASYLGVHGIFSIILVVAVCVFSFMNKKLYAIIPAGINFLLITYDAFISSSISGSAGAVSAEISLKFGAYLILLGAIVVLIMSVLEMILSKNK